MALTKSFPTGDAGGLSIDDTRRIFAGLIARASDGSPRLGVFPAHLNPLVTSTAGMAYSVAPFVAATSRSGTGAVEFVANDAATTVATTAAPASNSRIDVIWVRCLFTAYTDATGIPEFGVTKGTAGISPSKPTIPAGALELATASIPSTASGTNSAGVVITQTFQYTAAAGGLVMVRNGTELAAWAPSNGEIARVIDTGYLAHRIAGVWVGMSSSVLGPDGNAVVDASVVQRDEFGWVDLSAQTSRINGTSYAGQLILGVVPAGFRPLYTTVTNSVLTFGSGAVNSARIDAGTGVVTLLAAAPAGHTVAQFTARFKGA